MAATYAHATAPLRRLADRHVLRAVLALANGQAVPGAAEEAFQSLPRVMARAEARDGQIERAVIDLAEAVLLEGQAGEGFEARVTDVGESGARIQLCHLPVVARIAAPEAKPGDRLPVRLVEVDRNRRLVRFEPMAAVQPG